MVPLMLALILLTASPSTITDLRIERSPSRSTTIRPPDMAGLRVTHRNWPTATSDQPLPSDAIITPRGPTCYRVLYPLYMAVLNGDTLTFDLLGSDHELAVDALGYCDQTPFDLYVRFEMFDVATNGCVDGPYVIRPHRPKEWLDQHLHELETTEFRTSPVQLPWPSGYRPQAAAQ